MEFRIGVCGIACERCPRMAAGKCPNGEAGCVPRQNQFCDVCTCAFQRGESLCFECKEFPCQTTKKGPISFGYCEFISGKG